MLMFFLCSVILSVKFGECEIAKQAVAPALAPISEDPTLAATAAESKGKNSKRKKGRFEIAACAVIILKELDECKSAISPFEDKLNTKSAGMFNESMPSSWGIAQDVISSCCGLVSKIGYCTLPTQYLIVTELLESLCG